MNKMIKRLNKFWEQNQWMTLKSVFNSIWIDTHTEDYTIESWIADMEEDEDEETSEDEEI